MAIGTSSEAPVSLTARLIETLMLAAKDDFDLPSVETVDRALLVISTLNSHGTWKTEVAVGPNGTIEFLVLADGLTLTIFVEDLDPEFGIVITGEGGQVREVRAATIEGALGQASVPAA